MCAATGVERAWRSPGASIVGLFAAKGPAGR